MHWTYTHKRGERDQTRWPGAAIQQHTDTVVKHSHSHQSESPDHSAVIDTQLQTQTPESSHKLTAHSHQSPHHSTVIKQDTHRTNSLIRAIAHSHQDTHRRHQAQSLDTEFRHKPSDHRQLSRPSQSSVIRHRHRHRLQTQSP